ncbi:murein hydrolase activator EnvC family protein [Bartonella sp. CB178]|uniref:murein hydrolase activator EnvC family protein n=1 Tax=Bartonella sp. CB178 TaxID=3112255 RepID=UPI00300E09C3
MRCLYEGCVIFIALLSSVCVCLSTSYAEDTVSSVEAHKALVEIRKSISISRERVAYLVNQVERLKKDQRALTGALIKAAKAERNTANEIAEREKKLEKMMKKQAQSYKKLESRRAEFAGVLAILERMGLNPPPAFVVRTEDALASIRSSVLLGAVIPEMQEKIKVLSLNLRELVDLNNSIATEYSALKTKMQSQVEQRKHLELLLEKKEKLQEKSERELMEQRQRGVALAKKAHSLEDLILELDRQSQLDSNIPTQVRKNLQLLEKYNFEDQKGSLLFPVSGRRVRYVNNGSHITRFGEMIETESSAVVVAPANAFVAFAGPFRSYGRVVILNVGNGYHIILIGMSEINVTQGQFVLSGEPLGVMGVQFTANSVALDIGKSAPMLYIEFRKQGKPVNPTPWWRIEKSKRN